MRSNAVAKTSHDLPEVDTFMEVISKSFFGHQTWSNFFGSVSSTIGMMCLSYIFNNHLSNGEQLRMDEIARKKIGDAFNEAMHCLEKSFRFSDANAILNMAKKEFKCFSTYLKTDDYYQQLYINITYAHALSNVYLGELDLALADIDKCLLDFPQIIYRKHDMLNLLGIIHLKNKKYHEANKAFSTSLTILRNQQPIIQLMYQCLLKDSAALYQRFQLTKDQANCYLSNSLLFQTITVDPYIFEVNIAHIEALINSYLYNQAFEKLNALEKQYTTIILPISDQKRLYELFLLVLPCLQISARTDEEIKNERAESNTEFPSFFNPFTTQKDNALSKENLKSLENLYRIKLITLKDSVDNIISIKDDKKKSNQSVGSTDNPKSTTNWKIMGIFAVAAIYIGYSSMTQSSGHKPGGR